MTRFEKRQKCGHKPVTLSILLYQRKIEGGESDALGVAVAQD